MNLSSCALIHGGDRGGQGGGARANRRRGAEQSATKGIRHAGRTHYIRIVETSCARQSVGGGSRDGGRRSAQEH